MNAERMTLAPEAQQRVDQYLDAVERVLDQAGRPRGERRGITDEVEAQILEMLADRAGFQPTAADVEAVLAQLDPPEAYAEEGAAASPPGAAGPPAPAPVAAPRHFSRAAIVGACCAALACVVLVPLLAIGVPLIAYRMAAVEAPRSPDVDVAGPASPDEAVGPMSAAGEAMRDGTVSWAPVIMAIPLGLALLAGPAATTILGLVAVGHIRHSHGRVYGLGLAMFDALVFPLLAVAGLIVALGLALHLKFLEALVVALAIDVGLAVLACHLLGRRRSAGEAASEEERRAASQRTLGFVSLLLSAAGLFVGVATVLLLRQADVALPYVVFLACEAAALICGLVAWRATLPAKVGTIASAALMAVSLLFLA